ncbi:MAG: VWA domain-containing protein [Acidimicrobiia bacterium]|nr:VWA domain-containing protein [Acidimicrobiia bacterium]
MSIGWLNPWALVLLPGLVALWFFPRRAASWAHPTWRAVAAAALILALAQPVLLRRSPRVHEVFVVDESASVSPGQRARQAALVSARRQGPDDVLVVIGGTGESVAGQERFGATLTVGTESTSSLSDALAAAARLVPDEGRGRVWLFTDGLSTDRRWGTVVQDLIARGVVVEAHDLGVDERDVYPARILTDGELRVGQTGRVLVDVAGAATGVVVRLHSADGRELATSGPIDSDGGVTVPLAFEPSEAGALTLVAEVAPVAGDVEVDNNITRTTVAVQPPLQVLYLGDRQRGGAAGMERLLGQGYVVRDGGTSAAAGDLAQWDLVMVDDRPASQLSPQEQRRLTDAVSRQGVGLVFSGGRSAFGTGGYDGMPLTEAVPVEFVQRAEKRDPSTALAIIIDTSGSMIGTRMELAKQVARLAIRRLKAHDRVGIVEFYGNKHWAVPLQSAANKITIDRAIGRIQAIGGTVLRPGLEEAYYGLKNVDTRYKHILVITDAGVETADYEVLLRQITNDGINLSTVLVGAQAHNQLLIDLASWGKGRFYSAIDRYSLPEVILKQPSTMKLPAYKTGAFSVQTRGGAGWWSDINRGAVPALGGYVETTARDEAEVLMEVAGSGDPVVATWRYGLGRVTAVTTEPVGEGTRSWNGWKDYGRWLGRVMSRTAADIKLFDYQVERDDRQVLVTARRLARDESLQPEAARVMPTGAQGESLSFREVAPGFFEAEAVVSGDDVFHALAAARRNVEGPSWQPTRLVAPAGAGRAAERQVWPEDGIDLERLARVTGGTYVAPEDRADALAAPSTVPDGPGALDAWPLWRPLLWIALLGYISEVAWRRWPRRAVGRRA